jgi:hypothetical protein
MDKQDKDAKAKKAGRKREKAEMVSVDLDQKMRDILSEDAYYRTRNHLADGGILLAPEMAARLFEFYLSGSEPREIAKINPAIPIEAIWYAMVEQDWPIKKSEYIQQLLNQTKEKLVYAQSKTADMLSDMLLAAVVKNGEKYRQYLVTRDESIIKNAPDIKGIGDITKIIEAIQKITGADQVRRLKTEETHNLNISGGTGEPTTLESDEAHEILEILAASRRKNK